MVELTKLSKGEKVKAVILGMGIVFIFCYIFYDSWSLGILLSPLGWGIQRIHKKRYRDKMRLKLKEEFREGLYILSASISSGRSIEEAFKEALSDLKVLYHNHSYFILQEFEHIVRKISNNESIENALLDFAARSGDEDITSFAGVFLTAKRTGGNLNEIIRYTVNSIGEKMSVLAAIDVMVTEKKYELKSLAILFPAICLGLKMWGDGFLNPLYNSLIGKVVMTIALLLYLLSLYIGQKIVEIEV